MSWILFGDYWLHWTDQVNEKTLLKVLTDDTQALYLVPKENLTWTSPCDLILDLLNL